VHLTKSVFVLGEILVFVALLLVALVFVWRRGALDWK
jgi:NADH:ubiquinone oxidoreductase subunit 3 (subunit A)